MMATRRHTASSRSNPHANRHTWATRWPASCLVISAAVFGSQLGTIAGSLDDQLLSGVGDAIECAVAEDGVVEEAEPLVDAAVRGQRETCVSMPFDDQVVHILTLQCREAVQCEVIQDEQIWDEEAAEDAFVRVVGTRLAELFEQRVGAREQHTVAGSDGGGAERLDQKCFSDDGNTADCTTF